MTDYIVKLNSAVITQTDWAPMAQAAWNRAARDRDSAQRSGTAELWKDGKLIARVQPRTQTGHRWPDPDIAECGLREVLKAILQLLRDDEWTAQEIADAMTAHGLKTTRARIDAMRGSSPGKRTEVVASEVVVLLHAVLAAYKAGK